MEGNNRRRLVLQRHRETNTTTTATRPTEISHQTSSVRTTRQVNRPPAPPSADPRIPLQAKDENVKFGRGLLKSGTTAANMPRERSPHGYGSRPQPQMPSLSASASRAVNKAPLTPKIASKNAHYPPITATPSARRTQPPPQAQQQQRPRTATSTREATPSLASPQEEDSAAAALGPFLSNNITPRSGSRQSRVDSANNTPTGTPNPDRTEGWDPKASSGTASPPSLDASMNRRPAVSFGALPQPDLAGSGSSNDSKFFHASDAKSPRPPSSTRASHTKQATFFYANGNSVESRPPANGAHPIAQQASSQDSISSKFMHADGTPDLRPSPTLAAPRGPGLAASPAPRTSGSRPGTGSQSNSYFGARPLSPTKFPVQQSQVSAKGNHLPPLSTNRPQVTSPSGLGPSPSLPRRSSSGLSRPGHSRSGSLVKGEHGHGPLRYTPEAASPVSMPSPPAPLTLASIIQAAEDFGDNEESASPDDARSDVQSQVQSPTKSTQSAEPLSELVANARRERKVQDLQITNASLEAINRTLERQLRKQTAELRRFRRLSRSGRLSMASAAMSSRLASESMTEEQRVSLGLSDFDEEDTLGLEDDFDDEDSLSESDASDMVSPDRMAERDAKHRQKDEKRLELDLSKHQQLLIDSQKINQSIKRCLDWTEELIKDGKKALEYNVRVSDIELGGRVLAPADDDDEARSAVGGKSTHIVTDKAQLSEEPASINDRAAAPQDRDSGVELPAEKEHTEKVAP